MLQRLIPALLQEFGEGIPNLMNMGAEGRGRGRYCPPRHGKSSSEAEFPEHGTGRGSTKRTQSPFSGWSRQDHVELRWSNNSKWNNKCLAEDNNQFQYLRDVLDGVVTWFLQGQDLKEPLLSGPPTTKSRGEIYPCANPCAWARLRECWEGGGRMGQTSNLEKEGGEFPRQGSMEEGTSDGDM